MTTSPLNSASSASSASSGSQLTPSNPTYNLNSGDFIKMMITQLQNQDPLQPESNDQLMSQMSQIGQLQSNTQLQTTLTGLATQTQIGSASALIGKQVTGTDSNNNPIQGLVTSVQVRSDGVGLNLDSGKTLDLAHVTQISAPPAAGAAAAAAPVA